MTISDYIPSTNLLQFDATGVAFYEEAMNLSDVSFRIEKTDGTVYFVDSNRDFHRTGNLPALIHPNGQREYWVHGKLHNEHGPAITRNDLPICWALNDIKFTTQSEWEEALRLQTVREIHSL